MFYRLLNGEIYGEDTWTADDALDNCLDNREADQPFKIFQLDEDGHHADVTEDAVNVRNALLTSRGDDPVFLSYSERKEYDDAAEAAYQALQADRKYHSSLRH